MPQSRKSSLTWPASRNRTASLAILGILTAGGLTAIPASSAAASTPAPIRIGFMTSLSGPVLAVEPFNLVWTTFEARIAQQNALGGIDGHKLIATAVDDLGSATGALTAARKLVENDDVLAVGTMSLFTFAAARFLEQNDVPVVGGALDASEWGETSSYPNMFSPQGGVNPHYPAYTAKVTFLKSRGCTNIAFFGPAGAPTAHYDAVNTGIVARHLGIKADYLDSSVAYTQTDFTAEVLQMKSDGINCILAADPVFDILQDASNAGLKLKAVLTNSGYQPSTLDNPTVNKVDQGMYVWQMFEPAHVLNTPATKALVAGLKEYAHSNSPYLTQLPDYILEQGWMSADLLIQGLKAAGPNPTRSGVIHALANMTAYTAGGLEPQPINFKVDRSQGEASMGPGDCAFFLQLKGKAFVPVSTKPQCGQEIPGTNQVG
jgi:branched-chain amino acid transport system substrate-binding protein